MNERDEAARAAAELLEAIAADRAILADLDPALRRRVLEAAGRVSRPERDEQRRLAKAFRRQDRDEKRAADDKLLEATGIRELRRAPVFPTPPPDAATPPPPAPVTDDTPELVEPRKCYVCKAPFSRVHFFYDQMCPPCAELNWQKRTRTVDLRGKVALVTGARVKIGYHAAIMLLRAGARVVVATRFPRDAAARYATEADFDAFRGRLAIHGIDLRHTPSVEAFARHVSASEERLDYVIHNACQTVRRPPGFYAHLVEHETAPLATLGPGERTLLEAALAVRGSGQAALLTQLELAPGDDAAGGHLFPAGQLDADLQQVDLRERNSWRLALAEVPTVELLEVFLVNAVAPFVLNARLKPLMLKHGGDARHIVNVSAMEGQFYREFKTDRHPHTNMAKAALNMMTRTSAADYAKDGIYMNSVDTGWVTDEDPTHLASRKTSVHGFHPPLDVVDGAARIVDPIFEGVATGHHAWGKFFKDYAETPW